MRTALHAEWTKLRTVPGPRWLLLGMIVATVALAAAAASVLTCRSTGCGGDPVRIGVQLGQAPVAVLAVLVVSGEYSSGMIRATLAAVPHRIVVLLAKAVVLSGAVSLAAAVAVGVMTVGGVVTSLGAAFEAILRLTLIALLSLGIAVIIRDSAAGIGVVVGLLYLLPVLALAIGDPSWQRLLQQLAPASAGLAVTAGWSAAALVGGGLLLRVRDQ